MARRKPRPIPKETVILTPKQTTCQLCGRAHLQSSWAVLAIDGLQPDVAHKVLWVIRNTITCRLR